MSGVYGTTLTASCLLGSQSTDKAKYEEGRTERLSTEAKAYTHLPLVSYKIVIIGQNTVMTTTELINSY